MNIFIVIVCVLLIGCRTEDNTKCVGGVTYEKRVNIWYAQNETDSCLTDTEIKDTQKRSMKC